MPRLAWQVSTERIFTRSMPAFSICLTLSSSISSFGAHEHFAGDGIEDVLERHAAEDALAERLDDLAAFDQGADERGRPWCRSRTR